MPPLFNTPIRAGAPTAQNKGTTVPILEKSHVTRFTRQHSGNISPAFNNNTIRLYNAVLIYIQKQTTTATSRAGLRSVRACSAEQGPHTSQILFNQVKIAY